MKNNDDIDYRWWLVPFPRGSTEHAVISRYHKMVIQLSVKKELIFRARKPRPDYLKLVENEPESVQEV